MSARRRARVLVLAKRIEHRLVAVSTAVHTGLWLGLLDLEDLHAVDEAYYTAAARYLEESYNRSGLFGWEAEALTAHFPVQGRLLVLAAGAGREVLALTACGYEVVGYEPHPALLAAGRALLGDRARLAPLARDRAPTDGGPYDGVVVGWSAYMLVMGADRRRALLWQLRQLVRDQAPVLLSFHTRTDDDRRSAVVAGVGNLVRRLRSRPPVELGDDLASNALHRFTEREIADELTAGGFTPVDWRAQGPGPTDAGWAVGLALPDG